jgi:hypothetical protein
MGAKCPILSQLARVDSALSRRSNAGRLSDSLPLHGQPALQLEHGSGDCLPRC